MIDGIRYYQNVRSELLELIPQELLHGKLLEIGAGAGNTLLYAKENGYANEIHGVEICDLITNEEKNKFDSFIIGNVENMDLNFENDFFDVIICGDVLEHLIDPDKVLRRLRELLKPGGVVISSIPNIRNWSIIKKLVFHGDFKYEESGILDKTHLRFYCKKNIIDTFNTNLFDILKITDDKSDKKKSIWLSNRNRFFDLITFGIYSEFKAIQYFTVAQKRLK